MDNCIENRREKARAEKVLEAIVLEIQENQSSLDSNPALFHPSIK